MITPPLIERVFGVAVQVIDDPVTGTPRCIPHARPRQTQGRGFSTGG